MGTFLTVTMPVVFHHPALLVKKCLGVGLMMSLVVLAVTKLPVFIVWLFLTYFQVVQLAQQLGLFSFSH